MFMIGYTLAMSMIISSFLILISIIIGKKMKLSLEKLTPFECGFDPFKTARVPFSLRFFLVTILFLIFDVEIIILLPIGLFSYNLGLFSYLPAASITLILILGLFHEWNQGALHWVF
uniref:NADH-ubiquinone oxidoreductase chain 3 n=1 Tax=Pseudoniphargus sp. 1-Basque TaxID=2212664 RepID=A0A345UE47_9CRUS|nr:NADH dehydrogenase subunit 3 [Pseudoniphargus sp. 1-Basque]